MSIVSVINYKGGVGKTTVTANLAAELAWRNYDILLIDLDPQASLTFSFIEQELLESDFVNARIINIWFDAITKRSPLKMKYLIYFKYIKMRPILRKYVYCNIVSSRCQIL